MTWDWSSAGTHFTKIGYGRVLVHISPTTVLLLRLFPSLERPVNFSVKELWHEQTQSYQERLTECKIYPLGCCRTEMSSSTARAPAIRDTPGRVTVHCWSRVRSRIDWQKSTPVRTIHQVFNEEYDCWYDPFLATESVHTHIHTHTQINLTSVILWTNVK